MGAAARQGAVNAAMLNAWLFCAAAFTRLLVLAFGQFSVANIFLQSIVPIERQAYLFFQTSYNVSGMFAMPQNATKRERDDDQNAEVR